MDGNCVSARADGNSTKEFMFEVPITNLQHEASGAINNLAVNKITTIEINDILTSSTIDAITRKDADDNKANFGNGVESSDILKEVKVEFDAGAKSVINFDKIKDNVQAEETIDIDESESDVIDLDGNRTDSDVIFLDGKRTDSDVITLDGNKTDSECTIILDDDEIKKATERLTKTDVEVIDVENDTDCNLVEGSFLVKHKNKRTEYNEVFKDNSLLTELIEKCLDMENSEGMFRVINRTLLAIYRNVDENYKKSDAFRKILTKAIMQLDTEPEMKFSHIRNLCNELKEHQIKKRVPFITLEGKKDKEQSTSDILIPKKRRKVDDVIDLDDERNDDQHKPVKRRNDYPIGKVYPPIEIDDDDSSSDVMLNDGNDADDVILIDKISNKENAKKRKQKKKYKKRINGPKKKRGRPRKIHSIDSNQNKTCKVITDTDISKINLERIGVSDPGELLEPRSFVEVSTELNQVKINNIEGQIAQLKKRLEELEQAEVVTDDCFSPYVLCEQIKSKIVILYKQLCQLTGTEVTKRHEVRLQVVPGHPEGPVRCLEEFLNENIDAEGNPPFPDMHDVMRCVCHANYKYKMLWSNAQIKTEAHALFVQFGRSMQKRRQKREWKDLMSLVKQEVLDPADEDPELQARLLENTRIAKKNEDELLERFAKMEEILQPDPQLRLSFNQSEESDDDVNRDTSEPVEGSIPQIDHLRPPSCGIITDITSKKADEMTLETGLGPQASKIALAVDLTPKASENALRLVRTDDCDFEKAIEGSTVAVCGGNILVIEPTVTCVVPNENLPNVEAETIPPDAITPYSSEYQSFLHSFTDRETLSHRTYIKPKFRNSTMNNFTSSSYVHQKTIAKNDLVNPKSLVNAENLANAECLANAKSFVNAENLANAECLANAKRFVNAENLANAESLSNAESFANTKNLANAECLANAKRFVNAENLAKEILFLVQSDHTKTNGLLQEKNTHKDTVKPTNLCNTAENYSYLKNTSNMNNNNNADRNPGCNQNVISVGGFQIYPYIIDNINKKNDEAFAEMVGSTLALRWPRLGGGTPVHPDTVADPIGDMKTQCENIVRNEPDCNNSEAKNDQTRDTNSIENMDIIKPEPLDIPSMLEELGEGYTATIFDIEDPFMVIEISDSSESEDDGL